MLSVFEIGDHVRAVEEGRDQKLTPKAIYRVVGCNDDAGEVALLRVTRPNGRRAYSGAVVTCSPHSLADAVVPAENPDAGLALQHRVRTLAVGLYWTIRRFV